LHILDESGLSQLVDEVGHKSIQFLEITGLDHHLERGAPVTIDGFGDIGNGDGALHFGEEPLS